MAKSNLLLEKLARSCKRLPRLIELNAPVVILIGEIRLLLKLALDVLNEEFAAELRVSSEARKTIAKNEKELKRLAHELTMSRGAKG